MGCRSPAGRTDWSSNRIVSQGRRGSRLRTRAGDERRQNRALPSKVRSCISPVDENILG